MGEEAEEAEEKRPRKILETLLQLQKEMEGEDEEFVRTMQASISHHHAQGDQCIQHPFDIRSALVLPVGGTS